MLAVIMFGGSEKVHMVSFRTAVTLIPSWRLKGSVQDLCELFPAKPSLYGYSFQGEGMYGRIYKLHRSTDIQRPGSKFVAIDNLKA